MNKVFMGALLVPYALSGMNVETNLSFVNKERAKIRIDAVDKAGSLYSYIATHSDLVIEKERFLRAQNAFEDEALRFCKTGCTKKSLKTIETLLKNHCKNRTPLTTGLAHVPADEYARLARDFFELKLTAFLSEVYKQFVVRVKKNLSVGDVAFLINCNFSPELEDDIIRYLHSTPDTGLLKNAAFPFFSWRGNAKQP